MTSILIVGKGKHSEWTGTRRCFVRTYFKLSFGIFYEEDTKKDSGWN
jgi:hypothetical protein